MTELNRRSLLGGLLGLAAMTVTVGGEAEAKSHAHSGSRRRRARGMGGGYSARGVSDDGRCPCNGGNVCVGPRGGRYCITSSGRKRYGV